MNPPVTQPESGRPKSCETPLDFRDTNFARQHFANSRPRGFVDSAGGVERPQPVRSSAKSGYEHCQWISFSQSSSCIPNLGDHFLKIRSQRSAPAVEKAEQQRQSK